MKFTPSRLEKPRLFKWRIFWLLIATLTAAAVYHEWRWREFHAAVEFPIGMALVHYCQAWRLRLFLLPVVYLLALLFPAAKTPLSLFLEACWEETLRLACFAYLLLVVLIWNAQHIPMCNLSGCRY